MKGKPGLLTANTSESFWSSCWLSDADVFLILHCTQKSRKSRSLKEAVWTEDFCASILVSLYSALLKNDKILTDRRAAETVDKNSAKRLQRKRNTARLQSFRTYVETAVKIQLEMQASLDAKKEQGATVLALEIFLDSDFETQMNRRRRSNPS